MASKKRASKKKEAAATTGESTGRRGRVSQYSGQFIYKLTEEVPFREGSVADQSWKAIKKGILYETYIAAGGTRLALANMIRDGYAEVKKTKAAA